MILDIGENTIDTDEIENISPIYTNFNNGDLEECFKVYLKISFVVVSGGDIRARRQQLVDIFKSGKESKTL